MSNACTKKKSDERAQRRLYGAIGTLLSALAALAADALPARADAGAVRSYLVTSAVETGTGTKKSSETLTLQSGTAPAVVSVSNAAGASLSLPTAFAADGEILQNVGDPSVICYNMATAVLADHRRTPTAPSSVAVALGDAAVPIPLMLRRDASSGAGFETLVGSGRRTVTIHDGATAVDASLAIEAHLSIAAGELQDATFDEATRIGTPAKMLSRVTCSLSRLQTSDA